LYFPISFARARSLAGASAARLTSQAKAAIARALVVCSRKKDISNGKPVLVILPSSCTALQNMTQASIISHASWALFNGLEISDTAWLKTPPSTWGGNESYEKLNLFVTQLLITKRGVALISDY
jgi:hypothetical protein